MEQIKTYEAVFLRHTKEYIENMPMNDQEKVLAAVIVMEYGRFEAVFLKKIRGVVQELKVRQYRLIYFIFKNGIYITDIFVKKTRKTPRHCIDTCENNYKIIINYHEKNKRN